MELKSLTYTSWARPRISDGDIEAILRSSHTNNPLEGIGGVLIFNGGAFMQVLEGSEKAVDDMAERLRADKRHSNFFIRDERLISERAFPDWSMAYLRLKDDEFVGEDRVQRALARAVPDATRNIIRALTQSLPVAR
uniref:BLUF domain-containing protein n=1 Tax=uncultured Sphingomonas sp. TaxID=158754 RepID=UPI0025FBEAA1|nr:BLUF domain-containing protein [uncultured Sphingomonas sp.]